MAARRSSKAANFVRGETNTTLELANLGHAINLRVYRKGEMKGRLLVGQGAVGWAPRGWPKARLRSIPWDVFVVMMKEWPFGSRAEASLKFADGELRWRSPGKRGAHRKMSWAEFTARMEAPMTKKLAAEAAKAKARIRKEQRKRREEEKQEEPPPQIVKQDEKEKEPPPQVVKPDEGEKEPPPQIGHPEEEEERQPEPILIQDLYDVFSDMSYVSCPVDNGDILRLKRPPNRGPKGKIDVSLNDKPGGWVDARSQYWPTWDDQELIDQTVADLKSFVANPEACIEYTWKGENRCIICGRQLIVPLSKKLGIGPKCRKKYGSVAAVKAELARRATARRLAAEKRTGRGKKRGARRHPTPPSGGP